MAVRFYIKVGENLQDIFPLKTENRSRRLTPSIEFFYGVDLFCNMISTNSQKVAFL